jgi:Flp pilus assembly protein CpaB
VATLEDVEGRVASTVLLQRVLVVAVGQKTERANDVEAEKSKARIESMTFSLDLEESQLLALADSRGELSIAVRNADDQRLLEDIPDLQAANLLEAQQAMVARRQARVRPSSSGPVRLSEAN